MDDNDTWETTKLKTWMKQKCDNFKIVKNVKCLKQILYLFKNNLFEILIESNIYWIKYYLNLAN